MRNQYVIPLTDGRLVRCLTLQGVRARALLAAVAALVIAHDSLSSARQVLDTIRLTVDRVGHTATQLPDGRVFITGGESYTGLVSDSEIFDPDSRSFSLAARLMEARTEHTATLLADGRVLIAGGRTGDQELGSTEIFSPVTDSFSDGPSLSRPRAGHSTVVLADGTILIVGGDQAGTAEIFDLDTQQFTLLTARLTVPRVWHSTALLENGGVLIAGGVAWDGSALNSAEIFDPETGRVSPTRSVMSTARVRPTLHVLPDGKVQVIGGNDEGMMEMFNPEGEYFTAPAYVVDDNSALGDIMRSPSRAALIGRPASPGTEPRQVLTAAFGDLLDRRGHTLTEIPQARQALLAGGTDSSGQLQPTALLFGSSSATVTTDKTDYVAGELVIITGTGWRPGETVELTLRRDDGFLEPSLSTVADGNGDFQTSGFAIPERDVAGTYLLTALAQAAGYTAQTTFTDAANTLAFTVSSNANEIRFGRSTTDAVSPDPLLLSEGTPAQATPTVKVWQVDFQGEPAEAPGNYHVVRDRRGAAPQKSTSSRRTARRIRMLSNGKTASPPGRMASQRRTGRSRT